MVYGYAWTNLCQVKLKKKYSSCILAHSDKYIANQ